MLNKKELKIALVILGAAIMSLNLVARAEPPNGGEGSRRGPPPEAFEACTGAAEGEACSVDTPHGTLEGICKQHPDGDGLLCVPNNHRRGGPPSAQ